MSESFEIIIFLFIFGIIGSITALTIIASDEKAPGGIWVFSILGLVAALFVTPILFGYENTKIGSIYEDNDYYECFYVTAKDDFNSDADYEIVMSAQIHRYEGKYHLTYLYHPEDGYVSCYNNTEHNIVSTSSYNTVRDNYYRDHEIKLTTKKAPKPEHWKTEDDVANQDVGFFSRLFLVATGIYFIIVSIVLGFRLYELIIENLRKRKQL